MDKDKSALKPTNNLTLLSGSPHAYGTIYIIIKKQPIVTSSYKVVKK